MRAPRLLVALAAATLAAPVAFAAYAAQSSSEARELARTGPLVYEIPAMGTYVREKRIVAGRDAAFSPNGSRIVFVRGAGERADLHVADADGSRPVRITRTPGAETSPSWSPDGKRIAFERDGEIWIGRADAVGERRVTAGFEPAFSPDGATVAFTCVPSEGVTEICSIGVDGRGRRQLTTDSVENASPSWSPRSLRIAYASTVTGFRQIHSMDSTGAKRMRHTNSETDDAGPAWSPDGRRIAFVRDGEAWTMLSDGTGQARAAERARKVSWQPLPKHAELLPDLDQRAPHSLVTTRWRGRWVLAFSSAVDNVGQGPFWLTGRRRAGTPFMDGGQRVKRADGKWRVYHDTGFWRYVFADSHEHWHFLPFERYELRDAEGNVVVRDHKSGFCLGDTFRHASWVNPAPYFFPSGDCQRGNPRAGEVMGGTSVGYTDRYFPNYHGQNLRITGVPAGVYTLVHRVNPELNLFERRYENNAASVRIRLTWSGGVPRVRTLRACESSPRC